MCFRPLRIQSLTSMIFLPDHHRIAHGKEKARGEKGPKRFNFTSFKNWRIFNYFHGGLQNVPFILKNISYVFATMQHNWCVITLHEHADITRLCLCLHQQASCKNHRVNRVVFLGNLKRLLTTGVSRWNTRQIALWDQVRRRLHMAPAWNARVGGASECV